MKKCVSFLVATFFVAVVVSACKGVNKEETKSQDSVSFESFSPRSISVKNNTGERLVAFKGAIELSSLISGVPANASNHGLRMDPNLFAETGDFALLFITEKMFNENKNNLFAVSNTPFASIYAFYNKSGDNNQVYTISSKSGGSLNFTLHNNSAFNVEIRLNSPEGEVLGYVGAYTTNTVIKVAPGDATLFPIFKKYIARDKEIYSVKPTFKTSSKPYSVDFAFTDDTDSWNLGDIWDSTKFNLSSGGFYLTINNQSGSAVRFRQGNTDYETSLGVKGIKSAHQETFFVRFNKNGDGSYPEKFTMQRLTIGSANYPKALPSYEFYRDKKYSITVTGAEQDSIVLSEIKDDGPVDINKVFGL